MPWLPSRRSRSAHRAGVECRYPTELAALCPYVDEVYPISIDVLDRAYDPASALRAVPAGWDWVAGDARGRQAYQRAAFPGLARYYDEAGDRFAASGSIIATAGAAPPGYSPGCQFRLALPGGARGRAERLMRDAPPGVRGGSGPRIAVLAAGSGPRSSYPSVRSWQLILAALAARWPDALFCLVGKHRRDSRTTTSFGPAELGELPGALPSSCHAVDLPLIDQLAIVAGCDMLISPHSGFGMAALAVGTAWLSIAGNRWPEFYFNGVPFYSALPDLRRFPVYNAFGPDPAPVDDDGPRSPSMCYERVRDDLAEIVEGAACLIERRWPFETAMSEPLRAHVGATRGPRGPDLVNRLGIRTVPARQSLTLLATPDFPFCTGDGPHHAPSSCAISAAICVYRPALRLLSVTTWLHGTALRGLPGRRDGQRPVEQHPAARAQAPADRSVGGRTRRLVRRWPYRNDPGTSDGVPS